MQRERKEKISETVEEESKYVQELAVGVGVVVVGGGCCHHVGNQQKMKQYLWKWVENDEWKVSAWN